MDEDEIGTSDPDTSSWESEPHTSRSSRQYHPIKGEETLAPKSDNSQKEYQTVTNGDADLNLHFSDQDLLASQYLRTTFGLEKPRPDEENTIAKSRSTASQQKEIDNLEVQNGNRGDADAKELEKAVDDSLKKQNKDDEVIEELDLTKQPKSLSFGRGHLSEIQQGPQVMFIPSLGPFVSSPFGSLMTGLLSSDGDGFENDADVSSQSEAEDEARMPRGRWQFAPEVDDRSQQERWEHLFGMLEQQHRQQVALQQEHHERQVHLLQMQLARVMKEQEDLVTKQHQEPLGSSRSPQTSQPNGAGFTSCQQQDQDNSEKQQSQRRSPNGKEGAESQDGNVMSPDQKPATKSREPDAHSVSPEDSDTTLEGTLEDTSEMLMTTWSDVVEQKRSEMDQGDAVKQERSTSCQDRDERHDEDRIATLQTLFSQQQRQLQEQYTRQVMSMQQQWAELHTRQQQQTEMLLHLLSRQRERIGRRTQGVTQGSESGTSEARGEDRTTPISDDTSTAYSDFTYWRQDEQDTYRALPNLSLDHVAADQMLSGAPGLRSPHLSGQSSSPRQPTGDTQIGEEAQLAPSVRLNLREKHARHIADLKAYYDSEIQELQTKLLESSALKDHSPDKVAERTNQRLQNNCVRLEAALKSANSRVEDLENTVNALEVRLNERYNSADSSVKGLQQTVLDLKQLCRRKEQDIQLLEKRNRELQASLDQAYQLQDAQAMDEHRDQKLLKRVLNEYKVLAEKHVITKQLLHDTEAQLYDSKEKITNLTRTLSHLEFEVKRMDLDNSILKRQSLPQSLSGTSLRSETSPNTAIHTSTQVRNQTPTSTRDTPSNLDASSVKRSVEKKFLKSSADFNVFTGEELGLESGSESLHFVSDTESSLSRSEDSRPNLASVNRQDNAEPAFDIDEERPLSPMMKAARQFDIWKAEESLNAGGSGEKLSNVQLNGKRLAERQSGSDIAGLKQPNRNNSSDTYNRDVASTRGRIDGGHATKDASIHIWPSPSPSLSRDVKKHSSPAVSPGTSKVGTALAHSSPKQLARQSLANKAIKPKDHDLFPVRGSVGSPSAKRASPNEKLQSSRKAGGFKTESPRRQLVFDDKKGNNQEKSKNGEASLRARDGGTLADSVLARLRAGDVQTRADWEGQGSSQNGHTPKRQTETGQDIIKHINDHQEKLDKLMMEKRQLETTLSHAPISGRISRRTRQEGEHLEQRLEHVTRELGSVRMLLRKYNALKSSI